MQPDQTRICRSPDVSDAADLAGSMTTESRDACWPPREAVGGRPGYLALVVYSLTAASFTVGTVMLVGGTLLAGTSTGVFLLVTYLLSVGLIAVAMFAADPILRRVQRGGWDDAT